MVFSLGGVTRAELQHRSNQRAAAIDSDLSYIQERWHVSVTVEEPQGPAGFIWFVITTDDIDAGRLPALIPWCAGKFQEDGIPYELDVSIEPDLEDEWGTDVRYSATWKPGQKSPDLFSSYTLLHYAKDFLRNVGLLSDDIDINLVDKQTAIEYKKHFRAYCRDLHANAAKSLELNKFLGG